MGIMFLIKPLNSPGQSSLLQCGKLICNYCQKYRILSNNLIVFSLRMFKKKKFNYLNLSANVMLTSIFVTFADGVQPLELGDRPTNLFRKLRRYKLSKNQAVDLPIVLVTKIQRYKKSIGDILHRLISSVTHCLF